ncbi:MAG TPA: peptidase, partial [Gammaproteobacteria bacterium]|nr:peptidase [Gammaproteobacteria bacterium]
MRLILLVHRYLAVAIGLLMSLWCLSGFVMLYQAYPSLTDTERLAGLEPLDLRGCCKLEGVDLPEDTSVGDFEVEMLLGDPVLRLGGGFGRGGWPLSAGPSAAALDLRTGEPVPALSGDQAAQVAREYGLRHALGEPRALGLVDIDQWTVQDARINRPVYLFGFGDRAHTEIYVSGASGKVFQDTSRPERVLAWLGAIPHWLYPLKLRQNAPLWTAIVVWTSGLGTFLTLTGLAVGIWRFRFRGDGGRRSPFRGWWYWHHIGGLVFGVLALTWVFSGLMTMDPWGFLFKGGSRYEAEIRGDATWGEIKRFLTAPPDLGAGHELAQLAAAPFDGRLYAHAFLADGRVVRLDAAGNPATLTVGDV